MPPYRAALRKSHNIYIPVLVHFQYWFVCKWSDYHVSNKPLMMTANSGKKTFTKTGSVVAAAGTPVVNQDWVVLSSRGLKRLGLQVNSV